MTWTPGDVSGSETLTDNDHLYPVHVNELREAIDTDIIKPIHQVYGIGDSITFQLYPTYLRLLLGASWAVNDRGVPGDGTYQMVSRFGLDVLDNENAEFVIIWGGVNDMQGGGTAANTEANLQSMYTAAHNAGAKVIALTITPFKGIVTWDLTKQTVLDEINTWIKAVPTNVDYVIDAWSLLVDPSVANTLLPAYDDGSHIHPNAAGNTVIANAIYNAVVWTKSDLGLIDLSKNDPLVFGNSLFNQSLVNGCFEDWPRGVSNSGNNIHFATNWFKWQSVGSEVIISRQDGISEPSWGSSPGVRGSRYCARIQRTAGEAEETVAIGQAITSEDSIKLRGKKVNFSFWARAGSGFSPTDKAVVVSIKSGTGTDENIITFTGTITIAAETDYLTSYWKKYSLTTAWPVANGVTQLGVVIQPGVLLGTAPADDYFEICEAQLQSGGIVLPLSFKTIGEEKSLAQRFCYGVVTESATESVAFGCAASTTVAYVNIFLPNEMRAIPTLVATAGDWQLSDTVNAPVDVTAIAIDDLGYSGKKMVTLKVSVASGLTANRPYYLVGDGTVGRVLVLSAEL